MSRDALVVGINSYSYTSLQYLKAPSVDAEAIAQRLEQDGEFRKVVRLPEAIKTDDNVRTAKVSDKNAVSRRELKHALEQLFLPDSNQAPDTVLFYFSGHGLPDEKGYDKGYLATSDTNPDDPESGISLRWLQWLLSESPIKQQIVWLDCCNSGSLLVNVGAANPGNGESRDRCFIASSRDFESSWTDLNSPYSVLTKALLDGLDPRRSPGEWIDTFSLVDYVNKALKGELQTPVCTNFGEAINLTRTWQSQSDASPEQQLVDICPYKGLEYFDCNDTDPKYFFGRDRLVSELLDKVRTSNFMALVGASGNGKTSVLRAGLLHQIKQGRRITGSDEWRIRITRPDKQPMQNLALAFVDEGLSDLDRAEALGRASGLLKEGAEGLQRLIQASSAPRVILVVDQFEEVFTRCEDAEEREHYFACLMGAVSNTNNKLCLIIAMRADFIGKCLEHKYSGLAQHIQANMVSVLPMEPNELREVICKPAELVGLTIEPTLITTILNDIAGAPGSLPLLQYTLKELYQQRQGNQLVLSAYQNLGGITGTLDKRATAIYNEFAKDQQKTVQHIFQQLTQLGEGTEDTRRRVFQSDLVAEPHHSAAQVQQVIDTLSNPDNRLLVTSEVVSKGDAERMAIVDVAHEALIRHWTLLRQWIEKNRDLLRQQRKIEASAVAWRAQEKKPGYLLQGLPLAEAKQFQKNHPENFPLSDSAHHFIKKSSWHQRITRLKSAGWLIIPALILGIPIENNLHNREAANHYRSLDQEGTYEETQAVQSLVQGCREKAQYSWIPSYLIERRFGYCRSLYESPLTNANLSDASLRSADLSYASLSYASLSSADLSSADLRFADLRSADLRSAYLRSADLSFADLRDASLSFASLRYAYLRYADLRYADLRYASLRDASLSDADLSDADLSDADLSDADLSDADLSDADLRSADLRYASLRDASLSFADLRDAYLSDAILLAADFRNSTDLSQQQLSGNNQPYLCNVALPSYITDIDPNRDCDNIAQVMSVLHEIPLEEAQQIVEEAKTKTWD